MKIRGYKLWALFKKDFKLSLKNKNIIVVLLLPIGFSLLYTYLFADIMAVENGMSPIFVLILSEVVAISAIPLTVQGLTIAEEKERNTMRTLMLSDISSTEFLLSKSIVSCAYMLIITVLNYMICSMPLENLPVFALLALFASVAVIFFGSMVGIVAKDQTSASTLSTPFMIIFMLPAVFANFNELFANLARLVPTYSFQLLYEQFLGGNYLTMDNMINFAVILAWVVIGVIAFRIAYRKNLQDN